MLSSRQLRQARPYIIIFQGLRVVESSSRVNLGLRPQRQNPRDGFYPALSKPDGFWSLAVFSLSRTRFVAQPV